MKKDDANTWLSAKGLEQVELYTRSADVVVVERNRAIDLLCALFSYNFSAPLNLNVLDLGCGDGIVTERLYGRYPGNNFFLMDGSTAMLSKARKRLKSKPVEFIEMAFEEYVEKEAEKEKYHFVFSSMATHHLPLENKGKLYAKIHEELCRKGLFLNFDTVLSASAVSEKWQFRMWRDWMNETLRKNGLEDEVGKFDDYPNNYKKKEENKPSGFLEQLELLAEIGFKNVDCFFKHSIFALFGGTK